MRRPELPRETWQAEMKSVCAGATGAQGEKITRRVERGVRFAKKQGPWPESRLREAAENQPVLELPRTAELPVDWESGDPSDSTGSARH